MAVIVFHILIVYIQLRICDGSLTATITSPPEDSTTLIGNTAIFNCSGEGTILQWTYNGNTVTDQIKKYREIHIVKHNVSANMLSSMLYINATLDNDHSFIGCSIVTFSPVRFADGLAILNVRRISQVRNISLYIDDTPPYVTWIVPSVIASDVPLTNIRYKVILEGGDINSTVNDVDKTYYNFTNISALNCTAYTATVVAYDHDRPLNDLFFSNEVSASVDNIESHIKRFSIAVRKKEVYMNASTNDASALFEIQVNGSCSEVLQVVVQSTDRVLILSKMMYKLEPPFSTETILYTAGIYVQQLQLKLLAFINASPFSVTKTEEQFTTYHVQYFTLSNIGDGTINITCDFAIGSNATGCLVVFTSTDDSYEWNTIVYKDDGDSASSTAIVPLEGEYNVTVYDISGGKNDSEPAYIYGSIYISVPLQSGSAALQTSHSCAHNICSILSVAFSSDTTCMLSDSSMCTSEVPQVYVIVYGTLIPVICTSLIILAILILILIYKKHKKARVHHDIMQSNPAYGEVCVATTEKINMSTNMAYECIQIKNIITVK